MKNCIRAMIFILWIAVFCVPLVACHQTKGTSSSYIQFGDEYVYHWEFDSEASSSTTAHSYQFHSDNTGICEYYYSYINKSNASYNETLSGTVEFVWREAADGAIYLFETDIHYNEDHTEGSTISLISTPIYFSEDFFTYIDYGQYSASSIQYIRKGSKLEKLLED